MIELNMTTLATLIGIIGGILGIFQQVNAMKKQQEAIIREQAIRDKELDDKLERIEERLQSHNDYAKKFADMSGTLIEMQTDLKWLKEQK